MSVVIEHQEPDMAPIITKDGVTVFRSLGFDNSSQHVLMEAARDAAIRTASEAGDGTTTATILAEAFVRRTMEYCNANPHVSPQRVVRTLQRLFEKEMLPVIESMRFTPTLGDADGRNDLLAVAKISANGDADLADAVMNCFDIIGDEGNVTITEQTGPSKYIVQKIEGYPVQIGFEDSCGPFYQKFVNDPGTQTSVLDKPSFILYYGRITDFNSVFTTLAQVAQLASEGTTVNGQRVTHNVVLVATGFSETVLANLAAGFVQEGTMNIYPLLVPAFPIKTGAYDFLADLAALSGGKIFDPLENPLQNFQPEDLGVGIRTFEATRFRSNIIGYASPELVMERADQIQKQLGEAAVSELEKTMLRERLAKLTSGIAKLVVQGSSHGEIKERRDRAEDAVCAVRGAIKHGALPGGGVTLAQLSHNMARMDPEAQKGSVAREVAAPALLEPVYRLYENAGYERETVESMVERLSELETYDVLEQKWVDPLEGGLLDSLPAVREALRNAISIAALLGTCGGTIVFKRDTELERQEASDTADFLRNANLNEANERG
jgi:chaperonin GroEL